MGASPRFRRRQQLNHAVRVLLVPGFAHTSRVWDRTIALLGDQLDITSLDIPDEGDFASTATALGGRGGRGLYAGYSMGGRLALFLALEHPELVERLVLVSSSPGIADPEERLTRRIADDELADWIEDHTVDEFLDHWGRQPLFEDITPEDNRRHRLDSPAGIAGQLRRLGQGVQPPLWHRLKELRMPVTFIVGGQDSRYQEIADRAAGLISGPAVVINVTGAGHAMIHHCPESLATTIRNKAKEI